MKSKMSEREIEEKAIAAYARWIEKSGAIFKKPSSVTVKKSGRQYSITFENVKGVIAKATTTTGARFTFQE